MFFYSREREKIKVVALARHDAQRLEERSAGKVERVRESRVLFEPLQKKALYRSEILEIGEGMRHTKSISLPLQNPKNQNQPRRISSNFSLFNRVENGLI